MSTFSLPDLGEGLPDAEIVAWHVTVGDHVVADQPLVSVETAKAVVEVPSPQAGRIARLCAKVGERIKTGAVLVEFEEGAHPDKGAVVGELAEAVSPPIHPAPLAPPQTTARIKASPAVRARARALGVDLAGTVPTGPDGTITVADIERINGSAATGTVEPLRGVRRAMALNMMRAVKQIAPATVSDDADIGDWRSDEDVTVRLVRAVVGGCRVAPDLNAWFDSASMVRRLHTRIDLGLAVDTDDGLIVPVLRDVGNRGGAELRRGLDTLMSDVRTRKVPLADLKGQTITLSNFGMIAGRYAALTIVPPQVAILGAGRIRPTMVLVDGQPAERRLLPLSLTFDHRVVTGGEATRFLRAVIDDLARPL